ncbi:ABC transporter B family member 28 isoform X1 [Gossypium australe]|uniref:ABC transporter B family member 28 isoform X1 n=1 Tax=Gossypium australe TaxID=47621 RepID=A0A5B6VMK2_9ROSI|nr:ABC transporter B family member 28 isoform X1 [Gossypium australe]
MSMATASASVTSPLLQKISSTGFSTRTRHASKLKLSLHQSCTFAPFSLFSPRKSSRLKNISSLESRAYVTGPPIVSESDPRIKGSETDTVGAEPPKLISWRLLLSLLVQHKLRISVSVLALVGGTTCTLSMPIFSGRFFEVLIGARKEPLWKLLSKVGLLYSLEPIFTVIFVVNMNTLWETVMSTLRAQIFRRVLIQKAEFFDRYKVWKYGLLTSDLVVGTICILFALSPQLAPILGLLMLFVSVSVGKYILFTHIYVQTAPQKVAIELAIYKRSTVPVFKAHGMAQASMSDCVTETFSAIRTVRSFGGEKRQMLMFGSQVLAYQRSGIKLGTFKSINESLTRVAVYISLLALYCLGGSKVKAVQGLVNTFGDLRGTFAAVERINSVISGAEIDEALAYGLEKDIQKKEDDENIKLFISNGAFGKSQQLDSHYMSALKSTSDVGRLAWSGDVALEDVHFSYPLRPDVEILNGLNLTLKCGTVTALVGSSGSGKSTIVQLLARFYEPTRGRITVSGEDVRTFDKSEWARVVSIVNQEPVLFSVSVGENIAYGLPDDIVSKNDIIKAAKAANAHEFIISLPQGYDTLVGERGGLLSGGQRQRIAIARALLKNAPILILDEATSALDAVSERLVQDALNHLMEGRTTLVIAHRLSTVQNAPQIALCSNGQIAELGSHLELLARKGQYASLVDTQRLAFE